jgi:cation:H+ antiporter
VTGGTDIILGRQHSPKLFFSAAIIVGLALLAFASEQFVVGASRIATTLRMSPVVIGAVVIGAGTSLPELFVSGSAALSGERDIAMGNVVGSTFANLTLVLGAAALVAGVPVARRTLRRDAPFATAGVLLLALVLLGGSIARIEGVLLVIGALVAFLLIVSTGTKEDVAVPDGGRAPLGRESSRTLGGLVGTLVGANLMVFGASGTADEFGLSEGFVGLTLVALGTSLPELFTGVQAARKGSTDLVLGNVLGSNMFNCLAIGGAVAILAPGAIASSVAVTGSAVMVIASLFVIALMATSSRISRIEGAVLLAGYAIVVPILLI